MKLPFIFTCFLAALLAAAPVRQARAQDEEVSFDLFYNNLADDGDWYNTPEYGYVWQPSIAYKSDKWRPYTDGYWAQTDSGWTWVSYENFGWAVYHYGRWTRLKDIGWAWVPGYDWGPGWVSWRTNNDYVGWAPLPPRAEQGVYEGRAVERSSRASQEYVDYNDVEPEDTGYTPDVDVQFDIGPANYNFCETRYFGAPVIREVCLPPERNYVFIENTTNVTNIYYRRESNRTVVYNNGPDFVFINSHTERPIPRLRLDRRTDAGFLRDGLRSGGNPSLVRNGVLQVAAPLVARRQMNFTQIKPQRVKETIAQPQIVHGWSNSGANPQAVEKLREKFKEQAKAAPQRPANPVIPPAAVPGVNDRATANEQPRGQGGTDAERQARRDARQQERAGAQPGQPAGAQPFVNGQAPAAGNGQPPLSDAERIARRDARQKERDARAKANGQPATTNPANAADPAAAPANGPAKTAQDKEARRAARQAERAGQPPASAQPSAQPGKPPAEQAQSPKDQSEEAKAARRAARQQQRAQPGEAPAQPNAAQPASAPAAPDAEKEARRAARQQQRVQQGGEAEQPKPQVAPQNNAQADPEREARRAARQAERASQPAPEQAQPQRSDEERAARQAARAQQQQQQQAEQSQAQAAQQPAREARRAERQPEAQQQAAPQGQHAAQGDREARRAEKQKPSQPGQSPQPGQ